MIQLQSVEIQLFFVNQYPYVESNDQDISMVRSTDNGESWSEPETISYQNLNRPADAEEMYLEAIEIAPENSDYRYGISTLYVQQNQHGKALPHAEKLIELDSGNQQ